MLQKNSEKVREDASLRKNSCSDDQSSNQFFWI